MTALTTPGVYIEPLQPNRITGDLLRSDIAAFIGYAHRGPTEVPVRIESWRQFVTIFGEPVDPGHLALAIKAFFENGGITCYVLRIVDDSAGSANARLATNDASELWELYASFRIADIVTTETIESTRPDSAVMRNVMPGSENQPLENPGSWGNNLSISIQRSSRLSTQTRQDGILDEGFTSAVESLVGLEQNSIVELSQEQDSAAGKIRISRIVAIESIDQIRQRVTWKESLLAGPLAFQLDTPVRLDTVEYDVRISFENRQVEEFLWLGVHPLHSRSLHRVLAEQSKYLNLRYLGAGDTDWQLAEFWPANTTFAALQGGSNGLTEITSENYHKALGIIAEVDEVSVVAAPDLVLTSAPAEPLISLPVPVNVDCTNLSPPNLGIIVGEVTDGLNPLNNVTVTDVASGQRSSSDSNGEFRLQGLETGLRSLRFEKAGFESEERQIISSLTPPTNSAVISLRPLELARSLSELEILEVQRSMANPVALGPYRVALLDPPNQHMKIEDIRNWRAKVGDSAFAALYYPWIETPSALQTGDDLQQIPPCGHVAGLIARADTDQGPHRSAANFRLRFAKAVSQEISEIQHGILNPEGINAIRSFSGRGIRIFGSRTLSADAEWRYLSVRRLVLALEKTLERALQWSVFESNTSVLRQAIGLSIGSLLNRLWKIGALAGKSADAAYRIKVDLDNNPAAQRDQGILLAEVGIAPSVPFEFIRIRFGKTLDAIEVTE